jgi:hypothetical protein
MTAANAAGASLDIYAFFEMNPWSKIQRPMPSEKALWRQIERG